MTDATADDLPPPFAPGSPPVDRGGFAPWVQRLGFLGKSAAVGALALLLLIPLGFVRGVIAERAGLQMSASDNVRAMWGGSQLFAGPTLLLPYRTLDTGSMQRILLLPETLAIKVHVVPEVRYRGIFETVVYVAEVEASGTFPPLARSVLAGRGKTVDWRDASLQLRLSDPRSLQLVGQPTLAGSGVTLEPQAGEPAGPPLLSAAAASLQNADRDQPIPFSLRFRINGSGDLALLPLARDTAIEVDAPWDAPSFFGAFAPTERQIGSDGFTARWRISHLGTGLAQIWDTHEEKLPERARLEATKLGVTFLQPVTAWRESERAAKYGILFIALTLGVWLLFELVAGVRVHLLQYALVGGALCVFYLLLLSLAEQMGFAKAYAVSSAAVVLQTTAYTWVVTRRTLLTLLFAAIVAGLYAYLYVLLQLETQSLIGGSLVLFAALSAAMWATRRLGAARAAEPAAEA